MDIYSKFIDRPPVAAGRFYSAHAEKLEIEVEKMLAEVKTLVNVTIPENEKILALMAPHAGYVFSGLVAASAFSLLSEIKPRKRVFLIGSSHHTDFNGASIYNVGNYITPFGKVKVDIELANTIIEKSAIIEFVQAAHAHEHALEVMLPFIQYFWKDNFEIIPIVIATHNKDICHTLANELKPYLTTENLFVISTDLSHYPAYKDAAKVDMATTQAMLSGNPEKLLKQLKINKEKYIPNLATSMCGWTSVLTFMYMSESLGNVSYKPLLYQNSGDSTVYGDKDRVVGYQSVVITIKEKAAADFKLSVNDKKNLLVLARKSIGYYLENKEKLSLNPTDYSDTLKTTCGAFVSLHIGNELRGCIGRLQAGNAPLFEVVADMAVSSAFFDNRFSALSKDEISEISIEISVLTPLKKINSIEEIILGKHGIYIRKDYHSGTFLPQVAGKTNWTIEEYLGHCSRDKAGIGWEGWREAELFVYEAIIFKDTED